MPSRHPQSPSSVAETLFTPESSDSWSGYPIPTAPDDPLIGATLLETYRVDRALGEGGMGRIYEAHHTRLGDKRFAIKVLRSELANNPQIRARFEREVEAIAKVVHPGVLSVVDFGVTERGWPFMVSEHLKGLDLLAYLKRFGPLSNELVIELGRALTEALEATHAQGVIHRDVKPSNVFLIGTFEPLVPEWQAIKLIDFGLSRFVGRDDDLTKTGLVMGTPAYMSPEQAAGGETNQLTDVYGVGAVLYAAATGRPPFREETPQQTLLSVINKDAPRPREIQRSISEGLEVVIQRAMAKKPLDRYPNIHALGAALANLELGAGWAGSSFRVRALDADENVRGVRLRFIVLAGGAALLLVAGVGTAVAGLFALRGGSLQPTRTEAVLFGSVMASALLLLLVGLRTFERRAWGNTAKLSSWLPKLRSTMLAALVAYGISSLALRLAEGVIAPFAEGGLLGHDPGLAWPGWSTLLSLVALLAALATAVRQKWWQPERPVRRWLLGPALTAVVIAASFGLARWGLVWRSHGAAAEPPHSLSAASGELGGAIVEVEEQISPTIILDGGAPVADAAMPMAAPDASAALAVASPVSSTGLTAPAAFTAPASVSAAATSAPAHELAAAVSRGSEGLKALSRRYPSDPEVLKAVVLAHASRSSELADAVRSIEELIRVSPRHARDPDVRFILTKAASTEGSASRAALRTMSRGMGSAGPDLLYELMLKKPALTERAKERLGWASVRKLFSPELAVAYDLRFAPSCAARLPLLRRANEVGDQRSINVLSSLISKPPKCGRRGHPPCFARCERETESFSRSLHAISQRLRGKERAASSH